MEGIGFNVDVHVRTDGKEEVDELEKQLNRLNSKAINLKLNVDGDGADFVRNFNKQMNALNKSALNSGQNISKNFSKGASSVKLDGFYKEYFKQEEKNRKKAAQLKNKYADTFAPSESEALKAVRAKQSAETKATNDYIREQEKQSKKILEIQKKISQGGLDVDNSNIKKGLKKYSGINSESYKNLEKSYKEISSLKRKLYSSLDDEGNLNGSLSKNDFLSTFDQYTNAVKRCQNEIKILSNESSGAMKSFSRMDAITASNKTLTWLKNNSAAAKDYGDELKRIANAQRNASNSDELKNLNKEFRMVTSEAARFGKIGNNLRDEFKRGFGQIAQFAGTYGLIQRIPEVAGKMAQAVIAIDSANTELRKVSDASDSQIVSYFDQAAESAKRYGAAISDVISSTADWSRLGYSFEDSKILSDITTLYQRVGDNMTQETASKSLVSTLQGFHIAADDAEHIVDAFNEVGNNFAIGSDGIGEALQRSAASMYAAGNTMEQTIGLVTAANEVVQDPSRIGNGFKTISMRIRGAKTEMEELGLDTEGMVESTATLQKELLALTGVDIMKNKDTFKSTYDIFDEISAKWKNLTDIQRASVIELVAGKNQGNLVAALMENFEAAREATKTAYNSDGSASKELESYQKGIQYSLDKFQAQFQDLSTSFIDSDLFKGVIDSGTALLGILTDIVSVGGTIPTVLGAISSIQFIKNLDLFYY